MIGQPKGFILLAFLFALLPALLCPVVFPGLRLTFFAPFLCLMVYKSSLQSCLWFSLACGLILDLLSGHSRLGLYVINYCVTTVIIFNQKRHLFEDKISTLPLMTFQFSLLTTIVQATLLAISGRGFHLSGQWILTDLLLFPLADAIYALIWFGIPAYLLRRRHHHRDNTLRFSKDGS